MKKISLIAGAVALAFSAASQAADVEMYGLIDLGLSYVHSNPDVAGHDSTNKLTMENGREFGSRWGIRGKEDLGNGYKVGFTLESGFKADSGELDQKGDLFGREAHVDLYSPYGTLTFGVMPVFGSTLGANGLFRAIDPLFANYTEAFGSGLISASSWTRVDNAVSYVTPTWNGLTGYAQYSFKNDSRAAGGDEGRGGSADRYASLAVRYQAGAVEGIVVADTTMYGTYRNTATQHDLDDGYTVTVGGNYTFDSGLKLLAFYQYFSDMELNANAGRAGVGLTGITELANGYGFVSGWGASLGANYPLFGGVIKGQIGYRSMDNQDDTDFTRWIAAAGYDYPLSKRTAVYVMTGYSQEKVEVKNGNEGTPSGYEFTFGMVHRF